MVHCKTSENASVGDFAASTHKGRFYEGRITRLTRKSATLQISPNYEVIVPRHTLRDICE